MILIVTAPDDEPAARVEARLRRRGADVLRFDAADFPSKARISVSFRDSVPRYTWRTPERTVRFDTLSAVWYRKPGRCVAAPAIVDAEVRRVVEQDATEFLASVWDSLDCRSLPGPPSAMSVAQRKASQMGRAKALGFEAGSFGLSADGRSPPDEAAVAKGTEAFHKEAKLLDAQLAKGPYLVGNELTLADFAVAAPLFYIQQGGLPVEPYAKLRDWFGRVSALPAWKETAPQAPAAAA